MRLPVIESSAASSAAPASHFDTGPRSISAVKVLRISVTDRCNFRCLYCMPEEGVKWLPREGILTLEEIRDIVKASIEVHGIRRFKLTGGEPTVRYGLVDLVRMLRRLKGIDDLSLTTNGMLLEDLARPLYEAGLDRVTISIDSLDAERFKKITRTGELSTVLRGLDRSLDVGFTSVKLNCVTMRGTNDDEFPAFARLTFDRPLSVRFIEYMPLGDAALMHPTGAGSPRIADAEIGPAGGCGAQDRGADAFISEPEVRERIEKELGPLVAVDRESEPGVGPAIVYRLANGDPKGRVGFISAMSAPFCATCNRLRLTAEGVLRSCLFEGGEVPLLPIIRTVVDDEATRHRLIAQAMADCVRLKPDVHSQHGNRQMSQMGG